MMLIHSENLEEEFKKAIELEKDGRFTEAREKYKNIIHRVQKIHIKRKENK